jgi:linoleoyl-CoA desaturase
MSKVTFINNPRPFKNLLDERIAEYFTKAGLDQRGNWKLYSKTIILFVSLITIYALCFIIQPVSWIHVLLALAVGFNIAAIGFNVMHDAAHGSYSHNSKLNDFIAFIGGDVMGASTYMWKIKHNIIHHTYTNIEGLDDDIASYPLFRLSPEQKRKPWHKFQYIYGTFFYLFTTATWILFDDYLRVATKKIHNTALRPMEFKDHFYLWLGKILNLTFFLIIPMVAFGPGYGIAGFFLLHASMGMSLAVVFQMAHIVEDVNFPAPDPETMKIENEWMIHQVATTANFAMKSKPVSWFVGGLNYQIEHHLYPKISHIHYPEISKIVQKTCQDLQIQYKAFPTFLNAIQSHFRLLKQLGTA